MTDELIRQIVASANANRELMDGTTGPVRAILDDNDIVFGVWEDASEPVGVGVLLLKGQSAVRECYASGETIDARISAIACTCLEQAIACHEVLGEPERAH